MKRTSSSFRSMPGTIILVMMIALSTGFIACDSGKTPAATTGDGTSNSLSAKAPGSSADSQGGKPKLTFTETRHDFGKVFAGEELKHEFVFKNTGDGTLNIERVKAG